MMIRIVRKDLAGTIITATKAMPIDEAIAQLWAIAAEDGHTISDGTDGAFHVIGTDGKVVDTWYVH
ncbi:hypothetical protein OAA43_00300 [bacterium]|nr:hypothetical protein [bacterium]